MRLLRRMTRSTPLNGVLPCMTRTLARLPITSYTTSQDQDCKQRTEAKAPIYWPTILLCGFQEKVMCVSHNHRPTPILTRTLVKTAQGFGSVDRTIGSNVTSLLRPNFPAIILVSTIWKILVFP